MAEREQERLPADLHVLLRVDGNEHRATLYNISRTGGMIECGDAAVLEGRTVFLRLDALPWCAGKVVWGRIGHAGIQFDSALSEGVVSHLGQPQGARSESLTKPVDRFGRPLPPLQRRSNS